MDRQKRACSIAINGDQVVTAAYAYSDFFRFFRSGSPIRSGSGPLAPSGDSLSRLMTKEIFPSDGPVLELGAGIGTFTRALLARGIAKRSHARRIWIGLMRVLQRRFPQARVLWMDASQLANYDLFPGATVGAVVSGLPLLSMSPRKVMSILSGAFSHVRPAGSFYQFTYGPRCPVPRPILDRLGAQGCAHWRNGPQYSSGRGLSNHPPSALCNAAPLVHSRCAASLTFETDRVDTKCIGGGSDARRAR